MPQIKSFFLALISILVCHCLLPIDVYAEDTLPLSVQSQLHTTLLKVGSGTYRRFGFSIYRATLWAPNGIWDASKPYALELLYTRSLSQDTLADSVVGDIADQNATDQETFTRWAKDIRKALPAVEDGDIMIGLANPGKGATLFFNGAEIAAIDDDELSQAFFNIWLGAHADEDLKAELLKLEP